MKQNSKKIILLEDYKKKINLIDSDSEKIIEEIVLQVVEEQADNTEELIKKILNKNKKN
jgi:hypothetical protein